MKCYAVTIGRIDEFDNEYPEQTDYYKTLEEAEEDFNEQAKKVVPGRFVDLESVKVVNNDWEYPEFDDWRLIKTRYMYDE